MTTYSAIANSEVAVGAPITNSLMTKNRDNPLAIQENDASAPTVAYATSATTAGSITGQGALATLSSVAAGQIDANSVNHSEISFGTTASSNSIGTGGTIIPEGFYWYYGPTDGNLINLQVDVDGVSFYTVADLAAPVFVYSDGTNMRLNNGAGSARTVYYRRLG